jgi:hypothetical protein
MSYKISDEDIEAALRYLKYNDPENATRDTAIALLEDLRSGFHRMAHDNPDKLLELQKEIDVRHSKEKPND